MYVHNHLGKNSASSNFQYCRFWQEVELQYPDGFSFVQVLDRNLIRSLENGDKELLAQIRKNYEEIPADTTCTATIEPTRPENEASDVEDSSPCTSTGGRASTSVASQLPAAWSREATELLINLYEEMKMKWRTLGIKRKTSGKESHKGYNMLVLIFQYFERIYAILAKHHDVNPSFLSGSALKSTVKTTFSTRSECSHTSSLEETSDMKKAEKAEDSSSSDTEKNVTEISNKRLSACRRREKRKLSDSLIDVVTKIVEQRKAEREERERKKDARAKEKNEILKQFLDILKNK